MRAVADWCDKAVAPGPGYGIVECPHCAELCVVAAGGTARTGCAACLRPLGTQPLLRMDLGFDPGPPSAGMEPDADDDIGRFFTAIADADPRLTVRP
jgi:hypothetical protein